MITTSSSGRVLKILSSVRLAVFLLAAIVAVSLVGTLLPYEDALQKIYGAV